MNTKRARDLVRKYNNGLASEREKAIYENWYEQQSEKLSLSDDEIDFEKLEERLLNKTLMYVGLKSAFIIERPFYRWSRIAIAASILVALGIGTYVWLLPKNNLSDIAMLRDVAPGGNKAVLTLANGQKIILSGAHQGQLAVQFQTTVNKTSDGSITYQRSVKSESSIVAYNTMTTPRGGQYSLILSDGTKVILNAASSITYPVTFTGNQRRVKLSGEAYFEVAHNKAMPFHVDSKQQDVEVLGTHFNINAYDDEPDARTTLLQGSVKVNESADHAVNGVLVPGEQAITSAGHIRIASVDVDDAVAWKNGLFVFDNESLEHAMLKISRWYDIKVIYKDNAIKMLTVGGSVSRFEHVSSILHLFEKSGKVHFNMDGKTLSVSKT